jgi:hypothetical protein
VQVWKWYEMEPGKEQTGVDERLEHEAEIVEHQFAASRLVPAGMRCECQGCVTGRPHPSQGSEDRALERGEQIGAHDQFRPVPTSSDQFRLVPTGSD